MRSVIYALSEIFRSFGWEARHIHSRWLDRYDDGRLQCPVCRSTYYPRGYQ